MDTEEHLRTIYRRLDALEGKRTADPTDQIIRDAARAADPRIPAGRGFRIETTDISGCSQCPSICAPIIDGFAHFCQCRLREGHVGSHLGRTEAVGGHFTWTENGERPSETQEDDTLKLRDETEGR